MSIFREKVERIRAHVPWFNKSEWEEVAKQAYSDDRRLKDAAYKQMCVWKARNPKLPLGVECTMAILYVQLCDNIYTKESKETLQLPHSEKDLQMIYCTAILRFVNHLKSVSENERTLYTMAYRHNIPEWIINLRHETAHGNTLPSLCLLRSAALIILQWLGEHYWQAEALYMEDYTLEEKAKQNLELSDVAHFLKVWLSVRIYEWGGVKRINQIPSEHLRLELLTILQMCSSDDDDEVSINDHDLTDSVASGDYSSGISETEDSDGHEQNKLKDVIQIILNKIAAFLAKLRGKKTFLKKYVVEKLVENRGFLSADVFLEAERPVNVIEEEVISILAHLWYDVLKVMNLEGMTYDLLKTLVRVSQNDESVDRSRMAALWVSQLTKMMSNPISQSTNHWHVDSISNIENMYMQNILRNLTLSLENDLCTDVHPILLDCLLAKGEKLPMLPLKPFKDLIKYQIDRLIKEITLNPNRFTSYILPGLLDLCGERFSDKTKQDLLTVVSVYTNGSRYEGSCGSVDELNSDSVKTVEMLGAEEELTMLDADGYCCSEDMNGTSPQSESECEEENTETVNWILYTGNGDWSRCALGITPWQLNSSISSMESN